MVACTNATLLKRSRTLPAETDAVVPLELAEPDSQGWIEMVEAVAAGDNVEHQGAIATTGATLVPAGTRLAANEPLTPTDLGELERIFVEAGIGTPEEMERIRGQGGLGLFVRSLVGLDRAAAKRALDGFSQGRTLTAHQHEFVNMIVEHLTARGVMDPRLLYESPFTDLDPLGVAGVFGEGEVVELIQILQDVEGRAAA
jgi:type I site-specific restriction endonuclease